MKYSHILEPITTKYLVITVLAITVFIITGFTMILSYSSINIDTLSKFVDSVFKTVAVLVAAVWSLNRYYASRADVNQLRVDADVTVVRDKEWANAERELALLIYRLDIVNTGKALIKPFKHYLRIDAVTLSNESPELKLLMRWPKEEMHPGGPIEPGSWSAINDAIAIPNSVKVVRLYLEIELSKNRIWNWHKTFNFANSEIM